MAFAGRAIGLSLANDTQSGMVRANLESALSCPRRAPVFLATIGVLVLALPLAACGRKGGLDPPPGGHQVDRGVVRTPVTGRGEVFSTPDHPTPYVYFLRRKLGPVGGGAIETVRGIGYRVLA